MSTAHPSGPPERAHVLIAVKQLRLAKSRLARSLVPEVRTELVLAMLRDTLAAVAEVRDVSAVTVVTPDPVVATVAAECGAEPYADPAIRGGPSHPGNGLNAALTAAARHVRRTDRGVNLIALQADLPALRADELDSALTAAQSLSRASSSPTRSVGRAIVVDHNGTGTAALLACLPDEELDPMFGRGSARRHLASGAYRLDGAWPGLRLDVDTLPDLEAACELGIGRATAAVLDAIGWNAERARQEFT